MTHTEKQHLVSAYESAWQVINPNDNIAIDINPNGWFEIKILINSTSLKKTVRCAYLLKQLAVMNGRILKDSTQQVTA